MSEEVSEQSAKPKIRLDEVTLMRTILAILIVFMHSFTCYNSHWEQPVGYVDVPLYRWLARVSFAFTLEAFVCISGYLYAFQRITLNRRITLTHLIISKLKRLILPSIIFSAAYYALFFQYSGVVDMVHSIISGCGHMWFLPMLFWCFIIGWLLERIRVNECYKMAFLVVLNLISCISFPLQLSRSFSFMVYYYGGFLLYKYSSTIKHFITSKWIIVSWLVFIISFSLLRPIREIFVTNNEQSIILKISVIMGNNLCNLLYASFGVIALYLTAVYYTQRKELKPFTIKLAYYCFGIYLFQQFILQIMFYKTSLPSVFGPYGLPWIGFLIATVISYVLSALLLKTKVGRFLIG